MFDSFRCVAEWVIILCNGALGLGFVLIFAMKRWPCWLGIHHWRVSAVSLDRAQHGWSECRAYQARCALCPKTRNVVGPLPSELAFEIQSKGEA